MKNTILQILLVLIFITDISLPTYGFTFINYSTGEIFEDNCNLEKYQPKIIEKDDDAVKIIEYHIGYAWLYEAEAPYNDCLYWQIPSFYDMEDIGKPGIGFRTITDNISGKSIEFEIIEAKYIEFQHKLPPVNLYCECLNCEERCYPPIIPYTGFYPEYLIKKNICEIYEGFFNETLALYPIQYDFEHEVVRAYTYIKYQIIDKGYSELDHIENSHTLTFYDLQGHKISNPTRGEIYLVRSGEKIRKIRY